MNGIYGINVRTLGVNRDNTLAYLRRLQPAFALVMNDPILAAEAQVADTRVIYRVKTEHDNDESLDHDPAAFVNARASAAPGAIVHTSNEIGLSDASCKKEIEYMKAAEAIGRKCCIINAATHKSKAEWDTMRPAIEYAVRNGHIIGVHVYLDGINDSGAWSWVSLAREYGGTWVITEFAWIKSTKDPYTGWRGSLTNTTYAAWLTDQSLALEVLNTPAMVYSLDHWQPNDHGYALGFGIHDAPEVLDALVGVNQSAVWKDAPVPQPPPPPATLPPLPAGTYRITRIPAAANGAVNVRALPSTAGAIVGKVSAGTLVTVSEEQNGWVCIGAGWVSRQNGAVEFTAEADPFAGLRDQAARVRAEFDKLEAMLRG